MKFFFSFFPFFFCGQGWELGRNVREKAVKEAAITHPRLLPVFVNECMDLLQELEKKKKRERIN